MQDRLEELLLLAKDKQRHMLFCRDDDDPSVASPLLADSDTKTESGIDASTVKSSFHYGSIHSYDAPIGYQVKESAFSPPLLMKGYFYKVKVLKNALGEICSNIDALNHLRYTAIQATSLEKEEEIIAQTNRMVRQTTVLISKTVVALHVIQEVSSGTGGTKCDATEEQIRCNLYQGLAKNLRDLIANFQAVQADFKSQTQERLIRQVRIVYPEATQKDIQLLVEYGNVTTNVVMNSGITMGCKNIKETVRNLQDKCHDLRMLERNVIDLQNMFVELSSLAERQGDTVNVIAHCVGQAKENAESAQDELLIANEYQKVARKRLYWMSLILIIIATLVLLPMLIHIARS